MKVTPGNPFQVGNSYVDRKEVNPDTIRKLAEAASEVKVEDNQPAAQWKELADRVAKNDSVSKDDLTAFQNLSKAANKEHRALHKAYRESGYKDSKIAAQLADVHVFQAGFESLSTALKMADAKAAVTAVAGASFGPIGTVAAYAAWARLSDSALTDLCDELKTIDSGKSHTLFNGNKVEQHHQEKLWQTMNQMLDGAIESGKKGKPQEINAQYYELTSPDIVGKLAQAAEAGNPVRINVDPGRLVAYKGSHVELDDVPDKLRNLLQLSRVKGDVGFSAYPITRQLGDPNDLMHRKLLRVGDQVLLSGMNANAGSGENVDAGYTIEGPAAEQLGKNFARDAALGLDATNQDIFGEKPLANFMDADINMGGRGLASLIDYASGLSPAGTPLARPKDFQELSALADKAGLKLGELLDVPAGKLESEVNRSLSEGEPLPISKKAKSLFMDLLNETMDAMRTPSNQKAVKDVKLPSGKAIGTTAVSLADQPTEREALLLKGISEAQKFIYVPAFVMTRPVAAALVARRDELKAEGKDLDIRVLADPGIYPDGGTPNEMGVEYLEDHNIPVRWAMLPRSGWHDRKVHAKQMVTDTSEFFGSTNFSNKGMRENWEHSGVVHFDESDPASVEQREQSKAAFEKLWEHMSYDCNTIDLATVWKSKYDGKDKASQIDEARYNVVRKILEGIETFEKESAQFMTQKSQEPDVAARRQELMSSGMDDGNALFQAVEEKMGTENFFKALKSLPSSKELEYMKPRKKRSVGEQPRVDRNSAGPRSEHVNSGNSQAKAAGGDSKVFTRGELRENLARLKDLLAQSNVEASRQVVDHILERLDDPSPVKG